MGSGCIGFRVIGGWGGVGEIVGLGEGWDEVQWVDGGELYVCGLWG
jgi:hypothetical protein